MFYDSTTVQPASAKAHVIIYSRPGCHLCDKAKQAIQAANCQDKYTLAEIDIESDPDLLKQYQFEIPVVTINGVEAFRHKLTSAAFREKLLTKSGGKPTFPTQS